MLASLEQEADCRKAHRGLAEAHLGELDAGQTKVGYLDGAVASDEGAAKT